MRQLYAFAWRESWCRQAWAVGLSVTVAVLSVVPLELQRRIVDSAIGNKDLSLLIALCTIFACVIVLQGGFKYFMRMARVEIAEATMRSLRQRTFCGMKNNGDDAAEIETAQQSENGKSGSGTAVSIIAAEVKPLGGFIGESFSVPVSEGGILIAVFCYMLVVQPAVAAAAIAVFLPQMIFVPILQAKINVYAQKQTEELREVGNAIGEDGEIESVDNTQKRISRVFDLQMSRFRLKYILKLLTNLLNHTASLVVLGFGGWMVVKGEIEVGAVVAFLTGVERAAGPWREMVTFYRAASDAAMRCSLIDDALQKIDGKGIQTA